MSKNIDGALAFEATLDIKDFNVSAEAMERRIRNVSASTVYESERMDQSILSFAQNGARYIVSYLVGQGMMSLVNSIVQTRGQFQQLEIAFETMLQSGTKSRALMNQMIDTAAKTPFDLKGVVEGAKSLLAYGFEADKVNETLIRLGNIASGLSIPLNDIVYLYGTTMTQGRLYAQDMRQFMGRGIPLAKELAEMYGKNTEEINGMVSAGKIGFADVEKVINKLTNSGGQFYNLMEKQSASLTGMIANLGDAWDMALNKIGQENQDVFAKGIQGAIGLVEKLDTVLNIVKAIAIAYGSYKAAIVVNTLATKGYTGIAFINNTVRQAKISLLKAEASALGQNKEIIDLMTKAEIDNIYALRQKISLEQHEQALRTVKSNALKQILNEEQLRYLSNKNLISGSKEYIKEAESVLFAEQKLKLSKMDLSVNSRDYSDAVQKISKSTDAAINSLKREAKTLTENIPIFTKYRDEAEKRVDVAQKDLIAATESGKAKRIEKEETRLATLQTHLNNQNEQLNTAITRRNTVEKKLATLETSRGTAATAADTASKVTATAATTVLTGATLKLRLAMQALWASMKANPIGWIITGVGLIISAFTLFKSKKDEATDAVKEFNDTTRQEIRNLDILKGILESAEKGTTSHKQALESLNNKLKEYNKELLKESDNVDELNKKYRELTEAIHESAAARIKAKYIEEIKQKEEKEQSDSFEKFKKAGQNLKKSVYVGGGLQGGSTYQTIDVKSIQSMIDADYDFINNYLVAKGLELQNLSGDAYLTAFNEIIGNVSKVVKKSTGATDDEVKLFEKHISQHLENIAKSYNNSASEVDKLSASNEHFKNIGEDVVKSIDYTSLSLSELDRAAADAQREIDSINGKVVKVETDNTRLIELNNLLGQINSAVDKKTSDLNTESGIETRIRQLQEDRKDLKIYSEEWKKLDSTITNLQSKLPSSKKSGSGANIDEQLTEKQLQSQLRLEQVRIEIMEDGYNKRKAALDLQHKQNLLAIDKEEKELIKARREAGKGGLSADEAATFKSRKDVENQTYLKAQNRLFDDEISYKKEQYAAYWRWVENMGEEVADKRFSSLLKDGQSYKDYLQKQLASLTEKQRTETLTNGEDNLLNSVISQLDELDGKKSTLDQFKQNLDDAISRASTLAEKMQAVADAKEQLGNNKTNIIGDDNIANAKMYLSQKDDDNAKQIQQRILNDFKSFEERKNEIIEEYKALRNDKQVQSNQELLERINKGEAKALSELQSQMLVESDAWSNLFSDLDSLSVSAIDSLITEIQQKMNTADLNLNPADMKAILDRLDEAKRKILDVNPFKAMGNAIKGVFGSAEQKAKHSSGNIKTDWSNLARSTEGTFQFVNDAISSVDVLKDAIGDTGAALIGTLQSVSMAGIAMAAAIKTAERSSIILAAVSAALTVVNALFSIFNKDKKKEKKIQDIQKNVDSLTKSYNDLAREIERAYGVDKSELIEKQNKLLEKQNEELRKQIQAEQSKKKSDEEKIKSLKDKIEANDDEIAENRKYRTVESIMGTDIKSAIDEFADAYAEAWAKGEKAAGKSANVVKNIIKSAIIEQLKGELADKVTEFMTKSKDYIKNDGAIDEMEQAHLDRMAAEMEWIADNTFKGKEKWLKDIVDADKSSDPLTGAIRGMSEETGSLIAGKFNAFVINQADQTSALRQALIYQQETAVNTRHLVTIMNTLKSMENKNNSLLSQGIGG